MAFWQEGSSGICELDEAADQVSKWYNKTIRRACLLLSCSSHYFQYYKKDEQFRLMERIGRFSSCRGVSFEIQPRGSGPFAILPPSEVESQQKQVWLPWSHASSFRVFPSNAIERSLSRPSSHFCDLNIEDDDSEDERQEIQDLEQQKLPSKREHPPPPPLSKAARPKKSRIWIMLFDQGLFTFYKRLFMACLAINITFLVLAATGHFPYARNKPTLFAIGNILALALCRSEVLLRFIFWLTVKLLGWSWVPLSLKTTTTSFLQSLGGIHSGCGVSSIMWLVYSLVLTLKDRDNTSTLIVSISVTILTLLCFVSLAAFPLVRHLHHNVFERTHRFAGWTALAFVWAFIILTLLYNPVSKSYNSLTLAELLKQLIKMQEFWFTVAITIVIFLPWFTVRRVRVEVTAPSSHASIIRFSGGVKPGILGRISPSPLSEWHGFGIISDGKKEHMMLAGAVGDYTKSLLSNPPSHVWVRQFYFVGATYLINMYNRVQLVATGSGISVLLSFILQPCAADVSLLWITKGVEENFGREMMETVSRFPKEKLTVYDTAISGRPNVSQLTIDAARSWGAQVVFVTSNPEGSRDVVNACKLVGIPAFAPIWDS